MTDLTITRLFVRHEPQPADLALVFGFHVPEGAAARARHAARLFHQGFVPRVLFTGGAPHEPGREPEAVRMARIAMDAGLPASAILIEPEADNTFQNVVFSREMLRTLGLLLHLQRILVVTCAWHQGRALRTMKACFVPNVEVLACPHDELCDINTWESSPECVRRVRHEAAFLDMLIRQQAVPAEL